MELNHSLRIWKTRVLAINYVRGKNMRLGINATQVRLLNKIFPSGSRDFILDDNEVGDPTDFGSNPKKGQTVARQRLFTQNILIDFCKMRDHETLQV